MGVEMGAWVSRKFQHFGPPGTPPPRGAGALLLGFGLCRALRPVCIFHTFFTFFFGGVGLGGLVGG